MIGFLFTCAEISVFLLLILIEEFRLFCCKFAHDCKHAWPQHDTDVFPDFQPWINHGSTLQL